MKSASDCIQTVGLMYDKFDRVIYVKDSPLLKYSKKWIEVNCGKTEEEIRNSMTNVDGYDVTLHDLLFEEVQDCVSYNQAQDLLGDGWTVDVIVHILSFMGVINEND